MKFSKTTTLLHLFGLLFCAVLFTNYAGNPPNGLTGAPGEGTCRNCHGGNNSQGLDGEITINGLPTTVTAGETYPVSVTVTNPNMLSLRAGFQMVALNSSNENAGSMANPSANSNVVTGTRTYHEHSPAMGYDSERRATWTVDWTAPQDVDNETVTFYAVGNITDQNNGSSSGSDLIVFTNQSTTVSGGGNTQAADLQVTNLQNFPAAVRQGEAAFYSFDVVNSGNVTATGEYDILMYLSEDQNLSGNDIEAGVVPTGNTPVGTINEITGGITAPADLPLGNYYLLIVIDARNDIEELDEENNILVSDNTIEVLAAANPLTVQVTTQPALCNDTTTGSATATAMGGSGEYTYQWSNGATTPTAGNLAAGTYVLQVTDGNGTTTTVTVIIDAPPIIEVEIVEVINNQCPEENNGQITIDVRGGTPPFIYEWSNGSTTTSAAGLPAGDHDVVITDANGCTKQQLFTLIATDEVAPVFACTDDIVFPSCADVFEYTVPTATDNCGIASIDLLEGLPSGDQFPVGNTTVTYRAYDLVGNPAICSFTVTVLETLAIQIDSVTDATALGNDGNIAATITGGMPPYTYEWSTNGMVVSNEEDPANLAAGTYELFIIDATGCTSKSDQIEVNMTTNTNTINLDQQIELFPNPTRGDLYLKTDNLTQEVILEILNLRGQIVQRQLIEGSNSTTQPIDLQRLTKGTYFVKMILDNMTHVRKIIVQ